MNKFVKNEKGITLTILVITTIIIIILTGIVYYSAVKDRKIAQVKALQSDIQTLRDKVSEYYIENDSLPLSYPYTNLNRLQSSGIISTATDTGDFFIIKLSDLDNLTLNYGWDFEKIRNNEITEEEANTLSDIYIINEESHNIFYVEGINDSNETYYTDYMPDEKDTVPVTLHKDVTLSAQNAKKYYGQEVVYNSPEGGKWRIFYYDADGKYGKEGTTYLKRDVDSDLNISLSGKKENSPSAETISLMKEMMPQWAKADGKIDNDNEQDIAYLYDKEKWSNYVDVATSEYAIGSPSLEMYIDSYNSVNHEGKNYTLESECNTNGYLYIVNGNKQNNGYFTDNDMIDYKGYNNMYCGKNGEKVGAWWLAAPSAAVNNLVCAVGNDGDLSHDNEVNTQRNLPNCCAKTRNGNKTKIKRLILATF